VIPPSVETNKEMFKYSFFSVSFIAFFGLSFPARGEDFYPVGENFITFFCPRLRQPKKKLSVN